MTADAAKHATSSAPTIQNFPPRSRIGSHFPRMEHAIQPAAFTIEAAYRMAINPR